MKKTFYILVGLIVIIAIWFSVVVFLNFRSAEPMTGNFISKNLVPLDEWREQQRNATVNAISSKLQVSADESQISEKTVSLFAVGDIMLSRHVGQKMAERQDYHYPFLKLKDLISLADISFGNLESPIIAGPPIKDGSFIFRADPQTAESLAFAGFDVLSLANNHILNQGKAGLDKTIDYLSAQNIDYCGAEKSAGNRLKIINANNLKIGFLCYSYGLTGLINVSDMNVKTLQADLKSAEAKADFIVISMHDGIEYDHNNSVHQKEFARAAIDNGADLVIGHHPHVVQNMEQYKGKYIFYSLGNFVFDQMWSLDTRQGMAVKFNIAQNGVQSIEYFPIVIDDYSQPRLANNNEKAGILKYLNLK